MFLVRNVLLNIVMKLSKVITWQNFAIKSSLLTGLVAAVEVKWEKLPDFGTKMPESDFGPMSETAFLMGASIGM